MPALMPTTNVTRRGTVLTLEDGWDAFITRRITLTSNSGAALKAEGSDHLIRVHGYLSGTTYGIDMGAGRNATGNVLEVNAQGDVLAAFMAVLMRGTSRLVNSGEITGSAFGLGLQTGAKGPGDWVQNYGSITGGDTAILRHSARDSADITVVNQGHIWGGDLAYDGLAGSKGRDTILNRGVLTGDVALGGGEDRFDNIGGWLEGEVRGGAGRDTFLPGDQAETFRGGAGFDMLDFTISPEGLRLALDGSLTATGRATGDRYIGIEGMRGSDSGADHLRGNARTNLLEGQGGADRLEGRAGADTLIGGAGNDTLTGGTGRDVLTGGAGADSFVFANLAEAGDRITDFGLGADRILVDLGATILPPAPTPIPVPPPIVTLATGGASPLPAHLFHSGTSNAAADSADRFVFRIPDATLWYDPDGSGARAPILLADLQDGAALTAAHIFLI